MTALILEAMAENKATLSELVNALPSYNIVKKNVSCTSSKAYHALEHMEKLWRQEKFLDIDIQDGLRVDYEHGWKYVRASRTEQLIRIVSESSDKSLAEKEAEKIIRTLEEIL